MQNLREHHIPVSRTARYYTLGDPAASARELWYVLHGYAQLGARFLRRFTTLDDGSRLIVAPEALSRFYVERPGRSHAQAPIGASWMTREDRLSEIDDYIRYLDALHAQIIQPLAGWHPRITVLGFSQGAATATRWVTHGRARIDRLILWGGLVPPDAELARGHAALRNVPLTIVVGERDHYITNTALADESARLDAAGIPFEVITFDGGHVISRSVFSRLGEG